MSFGYLRYLRDGQIILQEDGCLTYCWRAGSETLDLADVHTLRWWWLKSQIRWGWPIRLWTESKSMSIDPNAFSVPDRQLLVVWLRSHLLPQTVQLGQNELSHAWEDMARSRIVWSAHLPWFFGWRLFAIIASPTLFAALFGCGCWLFLHIYYPDLGPVDVSGPHDGPFGRILLGNAAEWALFLALPVLTMLGAIFGFMHGIIWFEQYVNRDAYDASKTE
jgi:hypothetical protein